MADVANDAIGRFVRENRLIFTQIFLGDTDSSNNAYNDSNSNESDVDFHVESDIYASEASYTDSRASAAHVRCQ